MGRYEAHKPPPVDCARCPNEQLPEHGFSLQVQVTLMVESTTNYVVDAFFHFAFFIKPFIPKSSLPSFPSPHPHRIMFVFLLLLFNSTTTTTTSLSLSHLLFGAFLSDFAGTTTDPPRVVAVAVVVGFSSAPDCTRLPTLATTSLRQACG